MRGNPSTEWTSNADPTTSNRRGTTSTWTFKSSSERTSVATLSSDSFEKAMITRSISHARTMSRSSSGDAEQRQLLEAAARLPGLRVDESGDVDAVLGMLEKLPRNGLTDVAGPDDERVLHIDRVAAGDARGR